MTDAVEPGIIRRHLLEAGTLRKCGNCDFETLERKYMRQHERSLGHYQDKQDQPDAKKYTPEQQAARRKNRKKWLSA